MQGKSSFSSGNLFALYKPYAKDPGKNTIGLFVRLNKPQQVEKGEILKPGSSFEKNGLKTYSKKI
jgi:hypothetical protein